MFLNGMNFVNYPPFSGEPQMDEDRFLISFDMLLVVSRTEIGVFS